MEDELGTNLDLADRKHSEHQQDLKTLKSLRDQMLHADWLGAWFNE